VSRAQEPAGSVRVLRIELGAFAESAESKILLSACERAFQGGTCVLGTRSERVDPLVARIDELGPEGMRLFLEFQGRPARTEDLGFAPEDSTADRAKALGLFLGVMALRWVQKDEHADLPASAPPPAKPASAPPPAKPASAPPPAKPASAPPPPPPPHESTWLLSVQAGLSSDPGLATIDAGGGLRLRAGPFRFPLFFRAGFEGYHSLASSNGLTWSRVEPALGLGTRLHVPFGELEFGLDAGLQWLSASHTGGPGSARVTPFLRASTTALLDLSQHWGLSLGMQLATVFSPTDAYIDDALVARSSGFSWGALVGTYYRFGD